MSGRSTDAATASLAGPSEELEEPPPWLDELLKLGEAVALLTLAADYTGAPMFPPATWHPPRLTVALPLAQSR